MTESLRRLAQRIRDECRDLARLVDRATIGWRRAQQTSDDLYLDSVALSLHGFYAGLERLFTLIGAGVDGQVPRGENWHQMLLEQMSAEVPSVRPAVVSDETRHALEEYRGFRHIVRNVYAFSFDPAKVQGLVEGAPEVFARARTELLAFAEFLEQRARLG